MNILPLLDNVDFKTIESAIAYDAAGMALTWNFVTCAGVVSGVAVTPTTGGVYDWSEPVADKGMYAIEIPASGGASANNDTEGVGWFTGVATGVLPWRGPTIGFRRAALNDLLIDGGTASTNLEDFFDGTGYAGGTAKLGVNLIQILGTTLTETATQIAAGFKKFFDVGTPTGTVNSLPDAVPGAANGLFIAGTNAATSVTTALTTTFTGNLTGSVASVTNGVTLANDAIKAATFDESTAYPLVAADSGATQVARVGADSDTLETLSDQLDTILLDTASLNDTVLAEITSETDIPATPTLRQAITLLYMWLRNDSQATATSRSVLNSAGSEILKATASDNGTTFSQGKLGNP